MVKANDIRLVIMTVRRSPEYVHKTLASLMLSDPLVHQLKGIHLVVGGADIEYLNQYLHHKNIQIHPMSFEEVEGSRDWVIHRKFCHNYYRCLTINRQDCHGLCICEDDVAFQDGFIEKMLSALNELEQDHKLHHYLLDLYLPNSLMPDPAFGRGKAVTKYLPRNFYGTQCIYYPISIVPEVARLIFEQGVAEYHSPGDLLIGKYLWSTDCLYGPWHSLVQHIGFHSTGLAGMFHRSYTFNTTAEAVNGKEIYEAVNFDLGDTIGGIAKKLSYPAQFKGQELIVDLPGNVPAKVVGNLSALYQLLYTLVVHAIMYTGQGEVIICVQVESIIDNDLYLHFTISDTGSGRQKKVFESIVNEKPVNEADNDLVKSLSYCASLATILGGEIWIEAGEEDAPPVDGCAIHFTVQLQTPAHNYLQPGSRILSALRGLSVLVVDDNLSNRNLLLNMLTTWGMQARAVEDGASALELLHKNKASGNQCWMVLLDASMPGTNGFTIAKYIHEHPGLTKFILMMMSGDIQGDKAALCREAGVHDHLAKPILQAELLEAFRYFVNGA